MKVKDIADLPVGEQPCDLYVVVDGKELPLSGSKIVTERGRTRVVLVPAKARASRAKGQPVKVSKETAEMLRENGIDPAMLIRDGVMEYESQGVNITPMLSHKDDYKGGIEDGVITDSAS